MRAPVGTITLVFSDIEGSTRLLEQLGDAYAAVLQDHRRIVRDAVAAHAGYEVDTEGDGFFVAFARAADAVRAAVAAQRGLGARRWPAGLSVRVRIGLHTGEPRFVGGGYIGLDVHRAARICAAAHGGQIVLSETTAQLLSSQGVDGLAMRDLGEHRLKDVVGPVRLYQLMADGLVADFPPLRALERRTTRRPGAFVGRRAELAALVDGLDDAVAGRGRLFLLAGEPGIGKSRLAEALAAEAQSRGARVLLGRCWQAGGAPAYWPWTEALRLYVRESDDETLAARLGSRAVDLAQVVPELRERFPHLPPASPAPPEQARFRLFDAISGFLHDAAQDRPILLVLDDLHAADEPSLLTLRFLTRALGRMRVLLVGVYRDVDPTPGPALLETLDEVVREAVTAPPLALAGLTEAEVGEYVDLIGEAVAREVVLRLRDQTEGNPLFVSEILRLHAMAAGPRPSGGERRLAIPKGVRDVIARRLTYLSAECEGIAVLASVLGRDFSFDVLARMAAVPADALLDALDEAIGVRVLAEVSGAPDRLRFAHVLIGETLYDGLTAARRRHLHRRAAAALEALHGDRPGPHLAELAYHAVAGDDPDRGVCFARAAGDRALELLAYEEAARLYRLADQAMALRAPAPPVERCELLIAIGDALTRAGSTEDAKATFLAACAVASTAVLPESFARAALGYGGRSSWQRAGEDHRLVPLLEQALAGLGPAPSALRARLLARIAGALRDQPSLEPRVSRAREAVAIARRLGDDDDTLAYALVALFMAIWGPDIGPLIPIADEVSAIAAKTGVADTMLDALTMKSILAWTALADADPATVDDEYAALAAERRQPAQQWQGAMVSVVLALFRGDLADAERLAAAALESGQARHSDADCSYRLTMFVLRREQGRLEEVRDLVRDAVDRYPGYRSFPCFAALLACELGPEEAARRAFNSLAQRSFAALPRDSEWIFCLSLLSEVAVRLGDRDRADEMYRLLLPYARLNATASGEVAIGSVARHLGLLATATERWPAAAGHFEDAIAMNTRMGARPWLARSQDDYARVLLLRGKPGDAQRARGLRAAATATYRELGMADSLSSSSLRT